jgi:hypothetical protein
MIRRNAAIFPEVREFEAAIHKIQFHGEKHLLKHDVSQA